jgi:transposase, IS30 family
MGVVGRPSLPSEVRRRFWRRWRAGDSLAMSAAAVGVSRATGLKWCREAGGVIPWMELAAVSSRCRLGFTEREEIACLVAAGAGVRQIARRLGRDPATISRELSRGTQRARTGYRASVAQACADARAARPKPSKLAGNDRLRAEVQTRLRRNHSPEQISARLLEDFPDDLEMRVSHETIYRSLYVQGRGGLRRELATCLRTGRAIRKPRRASSGDPAGPGRITGMVNISQRPPEAADRAVPGHWEGDLIIGKNNSSAIGTLVERTTGFVMLLHLPAAHGALEVQEAMITTISRSQIPTKTLTWDQGKEMANHAQISSALDLQIYFCDPRSPWQRGSSENTNGLLRQYFPKGTDLSGHQPDYLNHVANELNDRPRKRHSWKTPKEQLDKLLSQPSNHPVLR